MDAELFLKTVDEECNKHGYTCNECGFRECPTDSRLTTEERIQVVQDYLDEHRLKTYKEVLLEKFPSARLNSSECPLACRKDIFGEHFSCISKGVNCIQCWASPAPDEYQKEVRDD